jgi:hypothetical protein
MRLKAERDQAQRDEEQRFREQMLAKFAEDDRLEQMNAQRRRMKQLEHRRAVEKLIEERRKQFEMEKEEELQARREEERMEILRREIIEQERQKLLKEHAAHLLGYLPKGVLRDDQDVEMLGGDFQHVYDKSRRADPFSDESWMT